MKTAISCALNAIITIRRYVKWHIQIPYSPLFTFILFQSTGGGGGAWDLVPLSYASDNGAAMICKRGAKARERSDRAGRGFPLPR